MNMGLGFILDLDFLILDTRVAIVSRQCIHVYPTILFLVLGDMIAAMSTKLNLLIDLHYIIIILPGVM